jgi:hypothetical protein
MRLVTTLATRKLAWLSARDLRRLVQPEEVVAVSGVEAVSRRCVYSCAVQTYEVVLESLIKDDPEDSLRFHHLRDAPPPEAERGTAQIVAIHYSVLMDHVRGALSPDDSEMWQHVGTIERWQAQILARWAELDRAEELRAMPYREYLRTPEWQARRAAALHAASHRCQVCNTTGDLDVHHRTYERRGAELDEDLTVLCRPCHYVFHEHRL